MIDEINTKFPESQVFYFYCKNNDPSRSNFVDIASNLLSQFLHLNPNCFDFINESIQKNVQKNGGTRPTNPSFFFRIFEQIMQSHDSLYIGIDGLDECPEQERKLLSTLIMASSAACAGNGNVKFFVTSRREKDLDKSLASIVKFTIEPRHLENDITAYISIKASQLSQKFSFSKEKDQRIATEICTRPKGEGSTFPCN
jgi:hypothetical protein